MTTGYEPLLPFRPTNVMHQLGADSPAILLNGRQVQDGLAELPAVLWIPQVRHPVAAQGLLRAAAHQKAVVGICLAPPSPDAEVLKRDYRPADLFELMVRTAAEVDRAPPFFLHVQAPEVTDRRSLEFEAVRSHLIGCADAGFTSFGIDLRSCPDSYCAALAAGLLVPALDLELAVVVRLGAAGGGQPAPRAEAIAATVLLLKREGISPDLILLPGPAEIGEAAWALSQQVAPLIAPCALAWGEAPSTRPLSQAFVRALLGDRRLVALTEEVGADSDGQEALVYLEAMDVLQALSARGTATQLVSVLGAAL